MGLSEVHKIIGGIVKCHGRASFSFRLASLRLALDYTSNSF
jgi:hypothetical protein